MNVTVTNIGQSKMLCPVNRDSTVPLLPGQSIETYSDHYHLERLKSLAEHKILVEVDGIVVIDPRRPGKKRARRYRIDPDFRLMKRVQALKSGMLVLDSKLRKKISDLEYKLATIVPGKDISAFMNMLVEKADGEAKLGIFKRLIADNVEVRRAMEEL